MKTYLNYIFILILLACLSKKIVGDCPLQLYPSQTQIGFINADINYDPESQNTELSFTYPIKEALSTTSPKVLTGLNVLNNDLSFDLKFRVQYVPSSSIGSLNFKVLAESDNSKWKRLQFNFIATTNIYFSAGSTQFNNLPQTTIGARHNLTMKIDVSDSIRVKPAILSFISGISLSSKKDSITQIASLQKNIREIPPNFSWSAPRLRIFNQRLASLTLMNFEITSNLILRNVTGNYLNTIVSYIDSFVVRNISISYIIFNQNDFKMQNNIVYSSFTISRTKNNFEFVQLKNTDFTFIGIQGINHKINSLLNIQFILKKENNKFVFYNYQTLSDGLSFTAGFLQIQTKNQFQCSLCPESIYKFENTCLSECPASYVNVKNGPNSGCKFCNLSSALIPNANGTDCVCAKQFYFDNPSKTCLQCHYTCLQCTNDKACLTCDNSDKFTNRYLDINTNKCVCKDGFYQISQQKQLACRKCHENCKTCSGPAIDQCLTCSGLRQFDKTGRCQCGFNFVQQKTQCLCLSPNILSAGVCYQVQPTFSPCTKPNMIELIISNQKICQCIQGFTLYNENCLSCPQNFILNRQNGKCECPKNGFLNEEKCIVCSDNKYYDQFLQKCLCKNKLFQTLDGNCISCPLNSVYRNQQCQCVFNYYSLNGECVKCQPESKDQNCARYALQ